MLSEISQIKKDKYCMVSLIRVIKKKKKVKLIEPENGKVVARGWETEVGGSEERLIKGYKLSVI